MVVVSVAEVAKSEGCHSREGIVIQNRHSISLPLNIVHFVPAGLGDTAIPNDSNNLLRGCRATCSAAKSAILKIPYLTPNPPLGQFPRAQGLDRLRVA